MGLTARLPVVLALLALLLLVGGSGCARKRWTCNACVRGNKTQCASSSVVTSFSDRTEQDARCSASEQVCYMLLDDPAVPQQFCRGEKTSRMLGCSPEFIAHFEFQCTESTSLDLPIKAGP